MLRKLFWFEGTHDTWAANGTHHTYMYSPLTLKHLSHCHTKACMLAQKKLVFGVCSQ